MGCRIQLIKLILLSFLLHSLSSFECDPFFSQKYCQMLQEMNKSNGQNVQCHKTDLKCPIQIYQDFSYLPSNNLIMGIKAKKNFTIHSAFKNQQQFTLSQAIKVILEEIQCFFTEIYFDMRQKLIFQELDSPSLQYSDNFASLDGGAMILRLSSHKIKAAQSILDYNMDKYLYTDQAFPFEIVIALKEQVSIQRIVIRSSEIYSSIMNEFIVYGAIAFKSQVNQEDSWCKLVEAKAKNEATQQQYRTIKKVVRYLKIKILSAHGDWKYFTITQIKVYGSSVYAEAMTSYQQNNNDYQVEAGIDTSSMNLYQDLQKMILLAREGNKTIPQNNLITYFFQQLQKLTKIEQHQIYYLNNLTLKIQELQNITYPLSIKAISQQHTANNVTERRSLLYFKELYERQCYSNSSEQVLSKIDTSANLTTTKRSKQKPQSIFKVFYEIQQDAQQKQEMKKQIQSLAKQMRDMQLSAPPFSQITFILVNIACCVVLTVALGIFFVLIYRNKSKRILQIHHRTLQVHRI